MSASYTRQDFAADLSARLNLLPEVAVVYVDHILDVLGEKLATRRVEFRRFGIFEVVTRKARPGTNPQKPADRYLIPARREVRFRMSQRLADRLNPE